MPEISFLGSSVTSQNHSNAAESEGNSPSTGTSASGTQVPASSATPASKGTTAATGSSAPNQPKFEEDGWMEKGLKATDFVVVGGDLLLQTLRFGVEGYAYLSSTGALGTHTDGVADPAKPATIPDFRLPMPVNFNEYDQDDTRNTLSALNSGTLFLRGINNLLFPQITDYTSLDDATAQSDSALASVTQNGNAMLGDNVTNDLMKWLVKDGISPVTGAIGDTFAVRSQMTVTEHGFWGLDGKGGATRNHNLNSMTNGALAMLMGVGTMSNLPGYVAQKKTAENAYTATETDIEELRNLLGDDAAGYTDEELATMAEAAQSYAGSTDPEAYNTWWYEKYGDAITAEQMLQNMAAIGAQKVTGEPFPTIGDYLVSRAISGNVAAMGNEALLRNHAINQMIIDGKGEGENSWLKFALMAGAAGAQVLLNETTRAVQENKFAADATNAEEINPYTFIDQDGNINMASAASLIMQFGTIPLELAANLTDKPDEIAQYFGEGINMWTNAVFGPPIHQALSQHGNMLSEHYAETAGGQNNMLFYGLETGVGTTANFVYGLHQGRALREGIASGNAAYALPLAVGAAALAAQYIHYGVLAKPEEDVAETLIANGVPEQDIMHNRFSDLGMLAILPAAGWGVGVGLGALAFKGMPDRAGEPAPVQISANGPSGSIAGASVSANLSALGRRSSSRPVASV